MRRAWRLAESDGWTRWGWPALSAVAVLAAWWWFDAHGASITGDRWILTGMLASLGLAAVMQLAGTRRWDAIALGLFWLVVGVFLFLGSFAPPIYLDERAPEWLPATYRACFVVAAPLLLIGLTHLAWERWHERGDER